VKIDVHLMKSKITTGVTLFGTPCSDSVERIWRLLVFCFSEKMVCKSPVLWMMQ